MKYFFHRCGQAAHEWLSVDVTAQVFAEHSNQVGVVPLLIGCLGVELGTGVKIVGRQPTSNLGQRGFGVVHLVGQRYQECGVVRRFFGQAIEVGDTLMILESMKMEIPVLCESAGIVSEIAVAPGDVIREGDVLAIIL